MRCNQFLESCWHKERNLPDLNHSAREIYRITPTYANALATKPRINITNTRDCNRPLLPECRFHNLQSSSPTLFFTRMLRLLVPVETTSRDSESQPRACRCQELGKAGLIALDAAKFHGTALVKETLARNSIIPSVIPSGTAGLIQVVDVCVDRSFKAVLKDEMIDGLGEEALL